MSTQPGTFNNVTVDSNGLVSVGSVEDYVLDAEVRGGYASLEDRLDGIDGIPWAAQVTSATATSITLRTASNLVASYLIYVVTNPYSLECEVRRVTAFSGSTLTVATLTHAPAADTPALIVATAECPVSWFGAIADLSDYDTKQTNDTALRAAIASAKAIKGFVTLDAAYHMNTYVYVYQADDLRIVGRGGAMIIHPSDGIVSLPDGTTLILNGELPEGGGPKISPAQHRSGIVIRDSAWVEVRGIRFQGGNTSTDVEVNIGAAVYITNSSHAKVEDCHLIDHGGKLFQQDANANDYGLRVLACSSFGARSASNPGADALILGCRFEQPTTPDYDRIGTNGSSHGIYIYAGDRDGVRIIDCYLTNIRKTGIKVSGTATPTRNVIIQGNVFNDCGQAFEVGADDVQEHSNFVITGNVIIDCGTNRSGWNEGQSCRVLGTRGVLIEGNEFYYTRTNLLGSAGRSGISVKRYTSASQPVEQIRLLNNNLHALYIPAVWSASTARTVGELLQPTVANGCHYACEVAGTSGVSEPSWSTHVGGNVVDGTITWRVRDKPGVAAPGSLLAHGIQVREVGQGSPTHGAVHIAGNQFTSVAGFGLDLVRNVGLIVEGNSFNNIGVAISCEGNRLPIIRDNFLIAGATTSASVQLRLLSDSFPVIYGNVAGGRLTATGGQTWLIDPNGGSKAADHPLLGTRGRMVPTQGKPEVVFAYGDGWIDGDTVDVNGTIFTYNGTSSGANLFDSAATLITRIDALASFEAADYGSSFAPPSITNHIRVRWSDATQAADRFYVQIAALNATAGVVLANGTGASPLRCHSRGEQAASSLNSRTVIWSPLAHWSAAALLEAENLAANSHLRANGYYALRSAVDSGATHVLEHVAELDGTQEFRWSLNG